MKSLIWAYPLVWIQNFLTMEKIRISNWLKYFNSEHFSTLKLKMFFNYGEDIIRVNEIIFWDLCIEPQNFNRRYEQYKEYKNIFNGVNVWKYTNQLSFSSVFDHLSWWTRHLSISWVNYKWNENIHSCNQDEDKSIITQGER